MTGEAAELRKDGLPAIGEVIAQKYRVEGIVGSGGMGVVVAARHLQLGQTVAIKLLSAPEESRRAEANMRFIREAQAAATLHSDHVVRIYDVGTLDSGLPFMVMELLRGSDLGTLIDTQGVFGEVQAVDFVLQACDAIAEAHQAGIVHRDLKPSNLFVTQRSDGTPLLKVLDFGISKSMTRSATDGVDPSLTSTRAVMGSPYYMSPEQVRDARRVDGRADVWALGVILQELLTGEPVFQADTFPGVCAAIVADPPVPLRSRRPEASTHVEAVVLRCLEKDPTRRFQSVGELISALLPLSSRAMTGSYPKPSHSPMHEVHSPRVVHSTPARSGTPRSLAEDATLSAASGAQDSGRARVITGDTRTQLSADLMTGPTTQSAPEPRRRWPVVVGSAAVVTFAALAVFSFSMKRAESGAEQAPASASAATRGSDAFALSIDSTPPGAEVFDGQQRLGDTPLTLTLSIPENASRPRSFSLRKAGFKPYVVEQGPAQGAVRVHAALVVDDVAPAPNPTPAPPPAATPAEPASVPPPTQAKRPAQHSAPVRKPASAGAAPAAGDIRLER